MFMLLHTDTLLRVHPVVPLMASLSWHGVATGACWLQLESWGGVWLPLGATAAWPRHFSFTWVTALSDTHLGSVATGPQGDARGRKRCTW